jgi:hypothetical protein
MEATTAAAAAELASSPGGGCRRKSQHTTSQLAVFKGFGMSVGGFRSGAQRVMEQKGGNEFRQNSIAEVVDGGSDGAQCTFGSTEKGNE